MDFSEEIWEKIGRLWHGKHHSGTSPDDQGVRYFLKDWFAVRKSLLSARECRIDTAKAWDKVEARTSAGSARHPFVRYSIAAALVLGLGMVWLFMDGYRHSGSTQAEGNFPCGVHKAELMLANGERIILDGNWTTDSSLTAGTRFVNDLQKGELSYLTSADPCRETADLEKEYHRLDIPKGGDYSIILPDGTKVWLNSESSFRFPAKFKGNSREVWLDGEAYFKVARNGDAPFRVHLPEGSVTVLGTSFNVSAYRTDANWHTVLVNGKVRVNSVNGSMTLKPSEMYSINRKSGLGSLKTVDTDLYTSWVDGKFHFNAYTFEEIVKKLERWYDFEMKYGDEDIRGMHFTGTINKHRPMDDVLHFLEKTTDIHFDIKGKTITVSRTR